MEKEPTIVEDAKPITTLEAKREARRKRILENSSNRLEKITGRPVTEEPVAPIRDYFGEIPQSTEIHEDPEFERDVYEGPTKLLSASTINTFSDTINLNNENNGFETEFLQSFFQMSGSSNLFPQQPNNFPQQTMPSSNTIPAKKTTILESVIDTKLHIAIISTVVYVLFATGNQFYTSYNVFLYLLLWELAEMVIIKPKTKSAAGSILFGLAFALILKNVKPKIKNFVTSALNTMNKVFKDVAIFMFVFVCIHIGWEYFGSTEPKTFIEILGK